MAFFTITTRNRPLIGLGLRHLLLLLPLLLLAGSLHRLLTQSHLLLVLALLRLRLLPLQPPALLQLLWGRCCRGRDHSGTPMPCMMQNDRTGLKSVGCC